MIRAGLATLCFGLLACSPEGRKTHQVEIRGMQFVPAELAVSVGDTVVWTNRDVMPHTVTSPAFDSRSMASQARWQYKVTSAGEQAYVCTFHPTMHAKLIAR